MRLFIFILCLLPSLVFADALDVARLNKMVQEKKTDEAYALAQELADVEAGNPTFDLLYGLAALEAGHAHDATFAFERVLIADPNNIRARLELGRAHYMNGNYDAARAEFEEVLQQDIPPNVRRTVRKFMVLLAQKQRGKVKKTKVFGFVGFGLGGDTNVNAAATDDLITVPGLGVVQLNPLSQGQSDEFALVEGRVAATHALKNNKVIFGRAEVSFKNNFTVDEFDLGLLDLNAGIAKRKDKWIFRFPFKYQLLQLEWSNYRYIISGAGEVVRVLNPQNRISGFFEYSLFRYPNTSVLNLNQYLLGALWSHADSQRHYQTLARAYFGDEAPWANGTKFNTRMFYGFQVLGFWTSIPKHTPYFSLTFQKSDYNALNPSIGVIRDDRLFYGALGWTWEFEPKWLFRTEVTYTKNHSNTTLFTYDRAVLFVGLRYLFG